jgi:protein-tyrosine phosphatase
MVDLHSHLLPGLDDGARDLEESLAIARAMVADGVRVVAGTPHVRDDYPTSASAMETALSSVRAAVAAEGLPLSVVGGGEIALPWLEVLGADSLRRFALGDSRVLLIEMPPFGWPLDLPHTFAGLRRDGWVPVLAHPERNFDIQERSSLLATAVEAGALVQLTAASVDGRLGRRPAVCSRELVRLGLVHLVSSDAHAPEVREAGLSAAVRSLGNKALARWLVQEVPAALLAGVELPARPAARRRLRFRL